jgi:two-component system chemotaxis response regulator CheB
VLVSILARQSKLRVCEAESGGAIDPGTVYIARPDQHLTVTDEGRFAYGDGHPIRHVLSSINPLFISSAAVFGTQAIAVVLSGAGRDGTDGVLAVKAQGGVVIAQNEATSVQFGMPGSAIATGVVDLVLPIQEIAPALVHLVGARHPVDGAPSDVSS